MEDKTITEEDEEREVDEVLAILKDPNLFDKITIQEFDKTIAGEIHTRRTIFLCNNKIFVKNLQAPRNILVNGESNIGKSYVCRMVWRIFPEDLWEYATKISPEAFTYWHNSNFEPEWTWDGKGCYIEDISQKLANSDTFKVMASEGSRAIIVIKHRAVDVKIKGKPVMLATSAETEPKFEVLNRFDIIALDDTETQTKKIMEMQSREAEKGYLDIYDEGITKALSLLKRIKVRIPFARSLNKYFPKHQLRIRRDFPRFFDLIKASCALHQYQREKDEDGYYLPEEQDYLLAKEALEKIRSSSAIAGIAGLTHRLKRAFLACMELAEEKNPFTAKEIHAHSPFVSQKSWYDYLDKLAALNLLKIGLERREESDKQVTVYMPIGVKVLELPSFEEVNVVNEPIYLKTSKEEDNSSIPSITSNGKKGSIPSNANKEHDQAPVPQEQLKISEEKLIQGPKQRKTKITIVREAIKRLEAKGGKLIRIEELAKEVDKETNGLIDIDYLEDIIDKLARAGDIFKPKKGFIQRI